MYANFLALVFRLFLPFSPGIVSVVVQLLCVSKCLLRGAALSVFVLVLCGCVTNKIHASRNRFRQIKVLNAVGKSGSKFIFFAKLPSFLNSAPKVTSRHKVSLLFDRFKFFDFFSTPRITKTAQSWIREACFHW